MEAPKSGGIVRVRCWLIANPRHGEDNSWGCGCRFTASKVTHTLRIPSPLPGLDAGKASSPAPVSLLSKSGRSPGQLPTVDTSFGASVTLSKAYKLAEMTRKPGTKASLAETVGQGVIIVHGPTGTGKSAVIPWEVMVWLERYTSSRGSAQMIIGMTQLQMENLSMILVLMSATVDVDELKSSKLESTSTSLQSKGSTCPRTCQAWRTPCSAAPLPRKREPSERNAAEQAL